LTDRGQLLLSRRALLRSAVGAVAVASLPFGLKASDLQPLPPKMPENRWDLELLEQLVIEAQAPADRECVLELFGALGDVVDDVPFFAATIHKGLTLWTVVNDRAGVVVRCPGVVRISAVVVGADFDLKWRGATSFRPMEPAEDEGEVVWEGFDEGE